MTDKESKKERKAEAAELKKDLKEAGETLRRFKTVSSA